MHRTTIPLEGPVERELRQLAAAEKRSFKELVNELLKKGLQAYGKRKAKTVAFQWNSSDAEPHPDFDPADRAGYYDILSKPI